METQAASSPAEMQDVFNGEQPSFDEFSRYRLDGTVPERFKPVVTAESTTDDAPEQTAVETEGEEPETDPDSEPDEAQEPPQKPPSKPTSPAQQRILQLLAEKKELQRQLEAAIPTPKPAPVNVAQAAPETRPKPTVEALGKDGKPLYATYEDYVEDLADWKAERRMVDFQRQQAEQESMRALQGKLQESRARYEDADAVIFPAAETIRAANIPPVIKDVFAQSDVFIDLCYVVGSDPEELKKFISLSQSNPRAALAKVFEYERGVREALAKGEDADDTSGKAPEKKVTSAPKPPSPVNGASSRAFDVSDESLSPEEWARKRNADLKKRGKG